jgi:non-ribosomal peptide synthetase component F
MFPPLSEQGPLPLFSMHLLLVPRELVTSLQRIARSQGVSLFMLLLVAYKISLAKWTGSRDVMVSMLLDGRRHIQFKNVIGCFASMQWVRTTLGARMSLPDTIRDVRRSFWEAYGTQSALVEWQRALSAGRIGPGKGFEVSINFHNSQQWHWRLDGITATRYTDYARPLIRLDWDLLWFDLDHQPEGIQTLILYGNHRFSAARIQSFAADYLAVLQEIAHQ